MPDRCRRAPGRRCRARSDRLGERVAVYGGRFDARRRIGGGYRVRALHPPGASVTESAPDGRAPRVLIADDEELIRTGFRLILTSRGIDVIGEAADGVQAVAEAERPVPGRPSDGHPMPRLDGLEAAQRVLRLLPHCRVIMLTTFDLDRYVYAALAAGASGSAWRTSPPPTSRQPCDW